MISRRGFLFRAAGAAAFTLSSSSIVAMAVRAQEADTSGLITRVTRPQDLETPVQYFSSWLTPNDRFFVRSHFGPPNPDSLKNWQLHVEGDVQHALVLSLADLQSFEEVTAPVVVQCSGNGRAFFDPKVPGAQWERGAVGNAKWTGVRLSDVLKRAGLGPKAKHVQLLGADRPVLPTVPLFIRSIPIEKAMHSDTLLAYRMNGEPLPLLHGAPLRLIMPGWAGDACVKWLTHLNLQEREAEGYYMQTAYRMPRQPAQPGATVSPSDLVPVEQMVVKSLIARPLDGSTLSRRDVLVEGVAWTGEAEVVRVDISTDDGHTWREAELVGERVPYAWRQWRYVWTTPKPGAYTVLSRATDSLGYTQPMVTPWNPGGFLWNAVDRVRVKVTA
jgi:DMSO/TMAO reductase YedYZ molybdopterin-dependent catalytic subunit